MRNKVALEPIYGWGWVGENGDTRDIPEPFALFVKSANEQAGAIVVGNHEFSGANASFSHRHAEPDGVVNIEIKSSDTGRRLAAGYAKITSISGG